MGFALKRGTLAVALLAGFSGSAYAQSLFDASRSPNVAGAGIGQVAGVMRARTVTLNKSVSNSAFARTNKTFKNVTVELFPGRTVTLEPSDVYKGDPSGWLSWSGTVSGARNSSASLAVRGEKIIGQIQIASEIYQINPSDSGVHTITQVTPVNLRDDIVLTPPGSMAPAPLNAPVPTYSTTPPTIDVLFLYTDAAKAESIAASKTIRDEAILAITLARTAYANTLLRPYRLKMVGIRNIGCSYDENAGSYSQILSDVTNSSTCIGGRAATLRSQYNADLVAVLRNTGSACGVGWWNPSPTGMSAYGFSVTSRNCITYHSFAHETGHNIGLHHDRYVVSGTTQAEYHFGYVAHQDQVRTVMAYNNRCSDVGVYCTRIPYFSNTRKRGWYNNIRLGRPAAWNDPADNRTKLLDNWNIIAGWR